MSQQIEEILKRINQKWGHQTIRPARQMTTVRSKLETGFAGLDMLLNGIPTGHVTEITGRPTSGMTTLVHHIAAQAQRKGHNVVYIQHQQTLDGQYVVDCGVRLEKMLSVEVDSLIVGLEVAQGVIMSGSVGLVVLNLIGLRQRHVDLKGLLFSLRDIDCVLILQLSSFARSNGASVRLGVQRQKWLRTDDQIIGCLSAVTIQKNRFGRTGNQALLLMPLIQEAWQ